MKPSILLFGAFFLFTTCVAGYSQTNDQAETAFFPADGLPKNPEALLRSLDIFITQGEDPIRLAEELTGLKRIDWGKEFSPPHTNDYGLSPFYEGYKKTKLPESGTPYVQKDVHFAFQRDDDSPYLSFLLKYLRSLVHQDNPAEHLPLPLRYLRLMFQQNDQVQRLFFALRKIEQFTVTPELTKNILGPPTTTLVDTNTIYSYAPSLLYCYETSNYLVSVWFIPPDKTYTHEAKALHPKIFFSQFEHHRRFIADTIIIERKTISRSSSQLASTLPFHPPQTTEELLLLLKKFTTIPDGGQFWSFVENIVGLPRMHWGTESYGTERDYKIYRPYDSIMSHRLSSSISVSNFSLYGKLRATGFHTGFSPFTSTWFIVKDAEQDCCFYELTLPFDDGPDSFCLSPLQTREILGPPSTVLTDRGPRHITQETYTYETPGYEMQIDFGQDTRPNPESGHRSFNTNEAKQKKATLGPPEHQTFCGKLLRIKRKQYLRNYGEWAKAFHVAPIPSARDLLLTLAQLAEPQQHGREFMTRLSGLDPADWGEPSFPSTSKTGHKMHRYCPQCRNAPYGLLEDGGYKPAPMPYRTAFWLVDDSIVRHIAMTFLPAPDGMLITPKLVREIFGDPERAYIRKPLDYKLLVINDSNRFSVVYLYSVGTYNMSFSFPIPPGEVKDFLDGLKKGVRANDQELLSYPQHDTLQAQVINIQTPDTNKEWQ